MRNGIKILNPIAEYNENLLPFFNADFNIIGGGANATIVKDNFKFGTFESFKISYINTSSINNIVFSIDGNDLIIENDGSYIFSYRFFKTDETADVNLVCNVFVNGILQPDNELNQNLYLASGFEDNSWQTYAQTLDLLAGDVITMTFDTFSDTSSVDLWFDGLKLEYDNKGYGIPTTYSLPINYFLNQSENFLFIDSLEDLPTEVGGTITLLDNVAYYFTKKLDLNGNKLVGGSNTTILGSSSETSGLTSTGLGVGIPLYTSIYTTPIRNISFYDVDTAFSFDGTSNPNDMALDWTGVNFINVPNVGTIKEASNFVFDKGAFLNSKGLKFDGSIGTVALNNSLFSGDGLAGDLIKILSTCTITRRFRVIYSSVVASGSTVGINVDVSATIPNESYILDTINFAGGGTYLSGVIVTDNKTLFVNCKGISNTAEISQYYMNGNLTTTTISATNTPVKVSGTTTSASVTQKFTNTNNRATYEGSFTRYFRVTATLSLQSGNNNQVGCYIAKNGVVLNDSEVYGTTSGSGRAENIVIQTLVELSTNDYIEIFVENATATNNVLVTDLNVVII